MLLAFRFFSTIGLVGLFSFCSPSISVEARNLALLIGISDYELSELPKLRAPGNDVRLMYDTLRDRGFAQDDIVVLADKIANGTETPAHVGRPIAKAILDELDGLAARATQGDLVIVYYSGHGSYVRQDRKRDEVFEPSGYNQVLLAIDAKKRNEPTAEIKGAILDKVLKVKFDALKKNSFVWLILDACHSGGFTRDESVGGLIHFVDPRILDPKAISSPATSGIGRTANPWIDQRLGGKQVAFLAAPENFPAYEKEIGANGTSYSLFTHTLVTSLRAENFSSYRQLAQQVRRAQAGLPGEVPPPVFEGDLDSPIFDGTSDGPRNWLAQLNKETGEVDVNAGSLSGIRIGSVLAFQRDGRELGLGEVVSAGPALSQVRLLTVEGRPPVTRDELGGRLVANLVRPAVSFQLKVALPFREIDKGNSLNHTGFMAVESLTKEPIKELPIEWVSSRHKSADLYLRIVSGVIYLVPPTGELVRQGRRRTPAVAIEGNVDTTAQRLKQNLWLVLRQQNLRRIASEMRDTELAGQVAVKLGLVRDETELSSLRTNEKQECSSWRTPALSANSSPILVDAGRPIQLTHCDRVLVEVTNNWPRDVDVTLLYLDADGGIGQLPSGGEVRVSANQAHFVHRFPPIQILTWCDAKKWSACMGLEQREYMPVGTERLMIIIAEGEMDQQDLRTFQYLAQPTLAKAKEAANRPITRNGVDAFDELLRNAGLINPGARGEVNRMGDATIKMITWQVVPPSELARVR